MSLHRRVLLLSTLAALAALPSIAFDFPPWDTGHQSMEGDDGRRNNNPPPPGCNQSGSPVDVATGNFFQTFPILSIVGRGPALTVALNYHSFDGRIGPFGQGWSSSMDQRVIKMTDGAQITSMCAGPDGRRSRYVRNPDGSYTNAGYGNDRLTENPDGTFVLREKYGTLRNYSSNGLLASIVDRNGNTMTFQYDQTGFLTSATDASGRKVTFVKGASGKVASLSDPANRQFEFTYDANGLLTGIKDPLTNSTTMQYASNRQLSQLADPKGNVLLRATYNTNGTLATYTERGETWTVAYNSAASQTTETDSSGNRWVHTYNATGSITRTTYPVGGFMTRAYDARFNPSQFTDQNGNVTQTTYDPSGNPLVVKDALNNSVTTTYHPTFNFPLTTTDRLGNTTTFTYDVKGNLIKVADPLGNATQYEYDSAGQITKTIDPLGNATTTTYDSYGNVLTRTNALNQTSSATYDIIGNVTSVTDANGKTSQSTFDLNRHVTKSTDPIGGVTTFQFDASNNLTSATMPNGGVTVYQHDTLNRIQRVTNPIGRITTYAYDKKDNLVSRTDPNGVTTTYVYDAMSRMTNRNGGNDPLTGTYDGAGNLLTLRNNSTTLTYVYDALNRVVQAKTSASTYQPTTTITYTYDANSQRKTMTDPVGGLTTYSHDVASRLTSIQDPASQVFSFSHDGLSRRSAMTGPLGRSVGYTYNAVSRLTALTDQASAGNIAFAYTHDAVGNILSKSDNSGNHVYQYDSLYRLTAATHPGGQVAEAYAYDSMGNRLSSHRSATYAHDAANRLNADTAFDYAYDNNGNMIRKTLRAGGNVTTYSYDSENRLTSVQAGTGTVYSYRYDGFGRRISKLVAGTSTSQYIYDGLAIATEYSGVGALVAAYTNGENIDELLSIRRGGISAFAQKDHLGTVLRVFSAASVLHSIQLDSFGVEIGSTGSSQSPYGFTGREVDPESGLLYYRARYYDPAIGRFLSEDPIRFRGGRNFYSYARNNPGRFIDPLGLYTEYNSTTGQYTHVDPATGVRTPLGTGYAGTGDGRNNPDMENVPFIGPIPDGDYDLGEPYNNPNTGPYTMNLDPRPGTNTHGRDRFRFHGDNEEGDASEGCPIGNRNTRRRVNDDPDRLFRVVH